MKFKKFLAMTLAAAMVFTGVNVSGLGGIVDVFAAGAGTDNPAAPHKLTMTYIGNKVASDDNDDKTVFYNSVKDAIDELEAAGGSSATITLNAVGVGTAFTTTNDGEVVGTDEIKIDGAERVEIELNGGKIGPNGAGLIEVVCGTLKVTNSVKNTNTTQIASIQVGDDSTTAPLSTITINGTPRETIGLVDVESTRVTKIEQVRGTLSVKNKAYVETVDIKTSSPTKAYTRKSNTFTLEDSTIDTFTPSATGDDDSIASVDLKSGIFTATDILTLQGGRFVAATQQVVQFDGKIGPAGRITAGGITGVTALSNATANELIKGALDANAGNNNAMPTPTKIVARRGEVKLTNVPGYVTAEIENGNELSTSLDVETADKISMVKIAEKINYSYQNAGFEDKTGSVTVNKFITGAYVLDKTTPTAPAETYPIKTAVTDISATNLISVGPGNIKKNQSSEFAVTLTPKSDFIDPSTTNNTIRPFAKITTPGGDPYDSAPFLGAGHEWDNYKKIYFTNDVASYVDGGLAIAQIDDANYYIQENEIKCAAQSANKVKIIRGTNGTLVLGDNATLKPLNKDIELVVDPAYTVVKTTTTFNKAGGSDTFYTYEISSIPCRKVAGTMDENSGAAINAQRDLMDTTTFNDNHASRTPAAWIGWKETQFVSQKAEVVQPGTYGFISTRALTVPEDIAVAHSNNEWYIGVEAIKLVAGDTDYKATLESIAHSKGNSFDGITSMTNVTIFTDQGAYVLKGIPYFSTINPANGAPVINKIDILAGKTANKVEKLEVYEKAANTTTIPQVIAYDWYVNSSDAYEQNKKTSEEQEKKASYSQAELEQEIGKAVAETRINAVQDEINKGTIVTVEKAKADQDAAIAEATKGMVTADAAKKATDEAVAEATKDMVSKTDADAAKEAAVEAAKTEANQKLTDAEAAKTAAETAKTEAESKLTAAETAKTEAESKLTAAETAKTEAEAKATVAETAKTAAETKLTEANQKVTAAEAKAAAAEAKATAAASKSTVAAVEKGQQVVSKKNIYKVTNVSKKTVAFAGTMSTAKTIKIAKSVKINGVTYKVTSIAAKALKGNKTAKKVVIPNTVKKIGKKAFNGMSGVTFKASKSLKTKANKAK